MEGGKLSAPAVEIELGGQALERWPAEMFVSERTAEEALQFFLASGTEKPTPPGFGSISSRVRWCGTIPQAVGDGNVIADTLERVEPGRCRGSGPRHAPTAPETSSPLGSVAVSLPSWRRSAYSASIASAPMIHSILGRRGMAFRLCIAVVGPGEGASAAAMADAIEVGRLLAEHDWITLSGGRSVGVMAAVAAGAHAAGGVVVGLLSGIDRQEAAAALTVALPTGLGEARDAVLVTAADAVIGCGLSPGTTAELALAIRARKPVALVRPSTEAAAFFTMLTTGAAVYVAGTPDEAVAWVAQQLRRPITPASCHPPGSS